MRMRASSVVPRWVSRPERSRRTPRGVTFSVAGPSSTPSPRSSARTGAATVQYEPPSDSSGGGGALGDAGTATGGSGAGGGSGTGGTQVTGGATGAGTGGV